MMLDIMVTTSKCVLNSCCKGHLSNGSGWFVAVYSIIQSSSSQRMRKERRKGEISNGNSIVNH